jgi:hypothetical protein
LTELETKTEAEDFTDELSDEALDREERSFFRGTSCYATGYPTS